MKHNHHMDFISMFFFLKRLSHFTDEEPDA